ncbi:MAG: hypothetical protein LQ348_004688 [Seirophora lacunosa]|nr:MAG: hypothetical protein LQ348_004688 [Seirophora lacunosa]
MEQDKQAPLINSQFQTFQSYSQSPLYFEDLTAGLYQPLEMHSLKTLIFVVPFLAQAATAYWYVDFYENACKGGAKPATGTMTLAGEGEDGLDECRGGPLHKSGDDTSRSVGVNGITGSGLVVDLYAARGCPADSYLTQITEDDCFTSTKSDPVKFAIVRKVEPVDEEK